MSSNQVLIVEDRPEIQTLLGALVERLGLEAVICDNAESARHKMQSGVCLVFADMGLPGDSGLDLAHWMRRREEWAHVPVVIVTAHPDGQRQLEDAALENVQLMMKPFRFDKVRAVIHSLTRHGTRS